MKRLLVLCVLAGMAAVGSTRAAETGLSHPLTRRDPGAKLS